MNLSLLCMSFSNLITYIFYIFIALLALLLMITIHEFGHFIAGKKLGFKINEFAVGFGKVLLKRTTKDGILVTLRLIPLGGYCAFEGEDKNSGEPNAFNNKAPWKRLIVLFNGAFFNFLSAVLIFFILLVSVGYGDLVQVKSVDSYATNVSELKVNDVIYEVNGVKTDFLYDKYFTKLLNEVELGDEFTLTVKRDNEFKTVVAKKGLEYFKYDYLGVNAYNLRNGNVTITKEDNKYIVKELDTSNLIATLEAGENTNLAFTYKDNEYIFNTESEKVYNSLVGIIVSNYVYSFGEAFVKVVPFTCEWAFKIIQLLWQLITGQLGLDGVGGPITTINAMASYTQTSWLNLLILFPLISVNLAVFNLLPFPALDGARMVFVLIEWIRKKPINRDIEAYIHTAGLIILFGFVIVVDLMNLL